MKRKVLTLATFLVAFVVCTGSTSAEEASTTARDIVLSRDLLDLLRAEMREISGGVQGIPLAVATANWRSIQETSAKIRASYIMDKKLTPTQKKELEEALPERFRHLDAGFHATAGKIGEAAENRDGEIVIFHYARLLESCVACHAEFAKSRFPEFSPASPQAHHH